MSDHGYVPIYQKLFNFYKEKIVKQDFPPGAKIDSITRIMDRHKVSRETAKLVLNMLSEEGYILKKPGKGSFVTFSRDIQKIWGIVIPFFSSNMEDLLSNLYAEAKRLKRDIRYFFHYNEPDEEINQVGTMIRNGYEAVIVVPNYDESLTADFYRNLNQGNTRIVLVDYTMVGSFFNYVIQSYDLGINRAFNYLISQNEGNLLFVKDESWRGKNLVYELIEQSLQFFNSRLEKVRELFVISGIRELNLMYLKNNKIGGVLCISDTDSLRIVNRIDEWKIKLPDEISVVSYGNTELTKSGRLKITAIDCRYPEMAKETANLIKDDREKNNTKQYVLAPELVKRQT